MPACAPSDHVAEHPARHHAQRHHRQDCKTGHGCRLQGAEVDERQADADRHRADIGLDAGPDGNGALSQGGQMSRSICSTAYTRAPVRAG